MTTHTLTLMESLAMALSVLATLGISCAAFAATVVALGAATNKLEQKGEQK